MAFSYREYRERHVEAEHRVNIKSSSRFQSERLSVVIIIFHSTLSPIYKCLRYIVIPFYRGRVRTFLYRDCRNINFYVRLNFLYWNNFARWNYLCVWYPLLLIYFLFFIYHVRMDISLDHLWAMGWILNKRDT